MTNYEAMLTRNIEGMAWLMCEAMQEALESNGLDVCLDCPLAADCEKGDGFEKWLAKRSESRFPMTSKNAGAVKDMLKAKIKELEHRKLAEYLSEEKCKAIDLEVKTYKGWIDVLERKDDGVD